ncbi:MAG TPA: aminopeptidase, partial [Bacteroidales bacterium]|nr:aminopeptidase [Bacteroidales bacterium]HPT52981.1 aminopeptidase [Bacteroidales bacterium]
MKLKNIYTLLIINAMLVLPLAAQNNGITPDMLNTIQKSYAKTASNKALQNAIVNNDINKLAMSYENAGAFDSYFS